MKIINYFYIIVSVFIVFACQPKVQIKAPEDLKPEASEKVILGNDNFINNHLNLVKNKS